MGQVMGPQEGWYKDWESGLARMPSVGKWGPLPALLLPQNAGKGPRERPLGKDACSGSPTNKKGGPRAPALVHSSLPEERAGGF